MPISFQLTQEQKLIQESARKFASERIFPRSKECDKEGEFPLELLEEAIGLGLVNIGMPEEFGGIGLDNVTQYMVAEELASGCGGIATSCVVNDLGLLPIEIGATKEQKERFITPITTGKKLASFCLTEPDAGSDAGGLKCSLTKVDGGYKLNGTKQWITNGGYASQYSVFATLDRNLGHKGICCVVVPRSAEGVSTGPHEDKLGQRASNTTQVVFEDVFVPESDRIGEEGQGFVIAMKTLDRSRPLVAAIAVGIARKAYEFAKEYALERKQFGKPIANFQAIQHMIADMATELDAARLLGYRAAYLLDQGKVATLESAMAKRFSADIAMKICTDAVQIYGGNGYTKDYPVEKLFRDVKLMQIYEGTSQVQKIVIGREVLNS